MMDTVHASYWEEETQCSAFVEEFDVNDLHVTKKGVNKKVSEYTLGFILAVLTAKRSKLIY